MVTVATDAPMTSTDPAPEPSITTWAVVLSRPAPKATSTLSPGANPESWITDVPVTGTDAGVGATAASVSVNGRGDWTALTPEAASTTQRYAGPAGSPQSLETVNLKVSAPSSAAAATRVSVPATWVPLASQMKRLTEPVSGSPVACAGDGMKSAPVTVTVPPMGTDEVDSAAVGVFRTASGVVAVSARYREPGAADAGHSARNVAVSTHESMIGSVTVVGSAPMVTVVVPAVGVPSPRRPVRVTWQPVGNPVRVTSVSPVTWVVAGVADTEGSGMTCTGCSAEAPWLSVTRKAVTPEVPPTPRTAIGRGASSRLASVSVIGSPIGLPPASIACTVTGPGVNPVGLRTESAPPAGTTS